jgi:hypothetical protein
MMSRIAVVLALVLVGCKQEAERPSLVFVQQSTPATTTCLLQAELVFEGVVPAEYAGLDASLTDAAGASLFEGQVGVAGPDNASLTLRVPWEPSRGAVRGTLTIDGESTDVQLQTELVGPEDPEIRVFGLWDGDEVLGDDAVASLAAGSPWDDAVAVADVGQLVAGSSDPRAPHGAPTSIELFACAADGADCEPLASQEDPSFGERGARASLGSIADATCAALPERRRSRLVAVATNACGEDRAELSVRLVHDDCDGDAVLAASDCDDEEVGVAAVGDVAADGSPVADLSAAVGASEILLCAGTHAGGLALDADVTLRSVGGRAQLLAPTLGSTVHIGAGANVVLDGLVIAAGPGSPVGAEGLGGGSVNAYDAGSLTLHGTDLAGGPVGVGGALVGPSNGQLDVLGGVWSGGVASSDGGVALLFGGSLQDVEVRGGLAVGDGGGIALRDGELLLVDSSFVGSSATRGGALWMERATARVSGVDFDGGTAQRGGCIGASLQLGEVLDLRPSIVNLDPTSFVDCEATERGGAVWQEGGALTTVLLHADAVRASQGGAFALEGVTWSDAASDVQDSEATEGSVAWVSAGTSVVTSPVWADGTGELGGLHLTDGAAFDLQNGTFDGFPCGVWIADGALTVVGTLGTNDADVCGVGWTADFGSVTCDATGCL